MKEALYYQRLGNKYDEEGLVPCLYMTENVRPKMKKKRTKRLYE